MNQEKIKNSLLLKMICTLILPIFLFGIGFSMLLMTYEYEYPEIKESSNFYDSNNFKDIYLAEILNISRMSKTSKTTMQTYAKINTFEGSDGIIHYYEIRKNQNYSSNFIYLLVDDATNEAFTNIKQTVETDTIEKIKQKISNEKQHWILDENGVNTDIEKLKEDNIKYEDIYESARKNLAERKLYIYAEENNENDMNKEVYNIAAKWNKDSFKLLVGSIIVTIVISIYLCISIGHKQEEDGIYLNKLDLIPLEIILCIIFIVSAIPACCVVGSASVVEENWNIGVKLFIISLYVFTEICLISGGILIKKIKAKQLFKNSLTYRIIKWIKKQLKKTIKFFKESIAPEKKLIIYYLGFILISIILSAMAGTGIAILVLIIFWIWVFKKLIDYKKQVENVRDALKSIYEGKNDINLNKEELCDVLKQMSEYIEDIAGGFSNAIEENMKSERMKTELITNVSHDIKTPLTSIINYVDLLKAEKIENEKAKEYLQILDNKSQRLKKLIEDLVEASKASSGNIKLNKEKIDVKELVKQVTGEFGDKFKNKGLEVIIDFTEENMEILADNRYMYRIIENLYSNVAKYALENSRVYVDLLVAENHKIISIKNISKEKLNISPEELMQRFVRGDKSRNTEGSGLRIINCRKLNSITGWKI